MLESIGVVNLGTYVIGAFLIIILPGPNSLYVLATAASQGVKEGYKAASGILLGDTVLLVLTAAGAASVLNALPMLFYTVRVIGACYLAYLGARILWAVIKPASPSQHQQLSTAKQPYESRFLKALMLSLLNPKAILFLLSFLVQFVDPSKGHPWLAFLVLGGFLQLFSVLYLTTLIFGGAHLAEGFRRRPRLTTAASSAVGILFLGFAARMAFDR